VIIARLNDVELRIYERLLLSAAGVLWPRNKSRAFRKFLMVMDCIEKERAQKAREERRRRFEVSGMDLNDFKPPKATRGPVSIEIEDPEDLLDYEED